MRLSPLHLSLAALLLLAAGCVSLQQTRTLGTPLDDSRVASIRVGSTHLDTILAWFGPPDFIIDGSRQLLEYPSLIDGYCAELHCNSAGLRSRALEAPPGTVLLIYAYVRMETRVLGGGSYLWIGRGSVEATPAELMLYVDKDTLVVTDKAVRSLVDP